MGQSGFWRYRKSMCSVPTGLGSDLCFMLVSRNGTTCLEQVSFDAFMDSQRTVTLTSDTLNKSGFAYLSDLAVNQKDGESIYFIDFEDSETEMTFQGMSGQSINYGQTIHSEAVLFPPELSQNPSSTLLFKAKLDRTSFFLTRRSHLKSTANYWSYLSLMIHRWTHKHLVQGITCMKVVTGVIFINYQL